MPERPIRNLIAEQQPITAEVHMTVNEAARLMREKRVGALLIMREGRLVGIFTERDALFRVVAEGRDPAGTRLEEVMSANPRTIAPDRPFGHALHLMHEGGFRHVPVVEDGRPVGVVSARDALGPELEAFVAELEGRERLFQVIG
ncbi:MAG: cyclic nucleotide-binding/CBS domain-containing protein [Burkholderiales bacterium]